MNDQLNNTRLSKKMASLFAALMVMLLLSACQPLMAPTTTEAESAMEEAGSSQEAAAPKAVEFTAIDTACADGNIVRSDSSFISGSSQIAVNQEEGDPAFDMDVTFFPDAYPDSTWVLPGYGLETADGGFLVYHNGDGTGDLAGSRIVLTSSAYTGTDELPCEPVGPVALIEGVIISDLIEEETGVTATEFNDMDVACPDGGVIVSDNEMMVGSSDVEIVQEEGEVHFTVNVTTYPEAFPNTTWVVPGEGVDRPDGGFRVIHHGTGTGDFEGDRIIHIVSPAPENAELPCEPVGPVVVSEGVIIQTN